MLSPAPTRLPPPFPRPLLTRPVPTIASAGCILRFRLHALPPKTSTIFLFFVSPCARRYPTVTATSCCESSGRFDGDIRNIIIDVSRLCRHVATHGRGCSPPRINFRQNTTCSCNAPASTASPDTPISNCHDNDVDNEEGMEGDKEVEEGGGVDGVVGLRHCLQKKNMRKWSRA